MGPEHEFQLVLIKKQAEECKDIEVMRTLVLKAVEMMETQRQFINLKVRENWLSKPA